MKGSTLSGSLDTSGREMSGDLKGPSLKVDAPEVILKGPKVTTGGLNIKGGADVDAEVSGGMEYPEGKVSFPKIKVPKFGIALPHLEGPEMGVDVGSGGASGRGEINIQSPSASGGISSQSLEIHGPEIKTSGGAKTKVKMPKLFGKSKSKGGSASDLSLQRPQMEMSDSGASVKGSKGLSMSSGELLSGKIEGGSGFSVSPKSKSASLDLFKKSRHRSSSLSDEGGLASSSSPSGHLKAEGGDISLDAGGVKVKGKKGKLKFGTFGGFGSKSKGSYEVTLGEEVQDFLILQQR
ncbi:hypothetical protein AAFF_G00054170 [Aldrovandia affinis]|uniref:Uncharacterized protein n=1 Tax=Aldrovandia affinis TaxID=143900 RepID=A0AAD7S1A2_9TELE|nr:hypothetical protein AAFF_G00054170 [Aldrovandia affinis]